MQLPLRLRRIFLRTPLAEAISAAVGPAVAASLVEADSPAAEAAAEAAVFGRVGFIRRVIGSVIAKSIPLTACALSSRSGSKLILRSVLEFAKNRRCGCQLYTFRNNTAIPAFETP